MNQGFEHKCFLSQLGADIQRAHLEFILLPHSLFQNPRTRGSRQILTMTETEASVYCTDSLVQPMSPSRSFDVRLICYLLVPLFSCSLFTTLYITLCSILCLISDLTNCHFLLSHFSPEIMYDHDKTIQILKSIMEHPWWFQWLIIHLPRQGT